MTLIADVGSQDSEVVLINSVKNIGVSIVNSNSIPTDPEVLILEVHDLCGSLILEDTYKPATDRSPDPPRILNPSTGRYDFPFGLDNDSIIAGDNNKTTLRRDLLFTWRSKETASTASSLTINPGTGDNSILDWTAVSLGTPGDFISIQYIDPGDINQILSVIRDGAKIQINLATNGTGTITTIANDIIAAILLIDEVTTIVTVTLGTNSDGTALVDAVVETLLTGGSDGTEEEDICINVRVITQRICSLIKKLRLQIDKALKFCNRTGDDDACYLGYSDGQLVQYLEEGIQIINAYQPSGVFSFENYPYSAYEFTLIESALMAGIMSQQ
ncbi:hypothetical protein LCGC14_2260600, partial [marine sediment metagenome]